MPDDDLDIAFAVVEVLQAHAGAELWATGGIHIGRCPQDGGRNDNYIIVDTEEGDEEWLDPTQDGPATLASAPVVVTAYASSRSEVRRGSERVRFALDGKSGTAAGIEIERIFGRGRGTIAVEDAAAAEQPILGQSCLFDVKYRLPVEV